MKTQRRNYSRQAAWHHRALIALLPLALLATGCGAGAASPTPAATATTPPPPVPPSPTLAPATATSVPTAASPTTAGGSAAVPGYTHNDDYSLIAGQVHKQVACWVVTYVSPLSDIAADKYNNQLSLIPSAAWDATTLQDGAWLIVHGHVDPTSPQTSSMSCGVTGYAVDSLQVNPNAP